MNTNNMNNQLIVKLKLTNKLTNNQLIVKLTNKLTNLIIESNELKCRFDSLTTIEEERFYYLENKLLNLQDMFDNLNLSNDIKFNNIRDYINEFNNIEKAIFLLSLKKINQQ